MFDVSFAQLLLSLVIGLIVLGPKRLPVAIKTVSALSRQIRNMAASARENLSKELQIRDLQESMKQVGNAGENLLNQPVQPAPGPSREWTQAPYQERQ